MLVTTIKARGECQELAIIRRYMYIIGKTETLYGVRRCCDRVSPRRNVSVIIFVFGLLSLFIFYNLCCPRIIQSLQQRDLTEDDVYVVLQTRNVEHNYKHSVLYTMHCIASLVPIDIRRKII